MNLGDVEGFTARTLKRPYHHLSKFICDGMGRIMDSIVLLGEALVPRKCTSGH